jgi:hypothetical protein
MSVFKIVISVFVAIIVVLSIIPYGSRDNPKVDKKLVLKAPSEVTGVFEKSCADCHSNRTKWPWYSVIFPFSWTIKNDVKYGRMVFNIDEWQKYGDEKKQQIKEGVYRTSGVVMPLPHYLWFHSNAKLTQKEIDILKNWASDGKGYMDIRMKKY